jgi:carbamate kinase
LTNELRGRAIDVPVITVITRVLVDAQDASFAHPTKPIGPFYPAPLVETLKNGYKFVQIRGRWRRVVPSPEPRQIVEGGQIKRLVEGGAIVIACGGGGIPVIWERGRLRGVEAVIDKDLTAQLLATLIGANLLLNLTAVDGVYLNWGTERQRKLDRLSIKEAKTYLSEGQFPPGSMGPKVEAAVRFIEGGGERAIIAALEDAARAVEGKAGTCIER